MADRRAARASWLLAFDGRDHVVLPDGVVEWEAGRVVRIGREPTVPAERVVDLSGHLLLPGLIDLHCHAGSQAAGRLLFHLGRRDIYGGGFQNNAPRRDAQPAPAEDRQTGALATLVQLVKGGATTVLEAGSPPPMADALLSARTQVPIRLYLGPGFRSADYLTEDDGRLIKEWRADGGRAPFQTALDWLSRLPEEGRGDGLVGGVLYPSILDYCTAELLTDSKRAADERGLLMQIHACQSFAEFHEILHRTGRTPIEWLADLGVLGPRTSLAHCFATSVNPYSGYRGGRDLELLAESGTTVVHCPVAISRRGNALHSLDGYQQAGVRVALGTDTFPRDMLFEMRTAQTMAKLVENDFAAGSARSVLRTCTIAAAEAIGRPDLGRISVGVAADFVGIDLRSLQVGPVRDPVDAALSACDSRDVRWVAVAGEPVVVDGRITGVDEDALVSQLQVAGEAAWEAVPGSHWSRQSADEVFPRSFRLARPDEFPG
ncbi:MAG: amidohydrolase family protein [Dehalococcoidia bacterium]